MSCLDYLEEHHFVPGLCLALQLVALPLQLAQLVLQTSGQLLGMALSFTLPRRNQLHQVGLTLLHQSLQLGVHLPAVLQLLLSIGLQRHTNVVC